MIQGNVLLSGQGPISGQPVRQLTNQGDRIIRTQQQTSDGTAFSSNLIGEGGTSQAVATLGTQGNAGFGGQMQIKGKYKLILPEVFKETFEKEGDNRWRQQNADITDYFNYGFCESTFQAYANKVRTWRGKFPVSEDYEPNKSGLDQFNDRIPLEYGGSCAPYDEELLETPQNFNIFEKEQFIDVVLDQYIDNYSQVISKYFGQQRADFMELMQKRYILSQYVEKQSAETNESENEENDMGGRALFFQNNLSQYSVSENYAEYKRERRKNIDFIALHAQIIHNISQKNDSIHPNDAEKVYFLHDIFKNEMGISAAFNAAKPEGSVVLSNDTSKLPNNTNVPAKLPVIPQPFMPRGMMPFQQSLMQPFSQQYFGQLLKNQMTMGGQGYFPMGRNPYFMGGLQGMMNGMRGGMPQMAMMGFTGNMKQQQQMMNMQNQFYQMQQDDDFGGGYELPEGESNDGMYPNDRNDGNNSNRGGFNGRTDQKKTSYVNNNNNSSKEEKSRNRDSSKNVNKNQDSSRYHRNKSSTSRSRSRSKQTKYDLEKYSKNDYEKEKRKDKNDEGNNHKNDSKKDYKKDDDKRIKNYISREEDERDSKRHAGNKDRKKSSEKKKDRKEHGDSSKSRKRNASNSEESYSKKKDSNKSKKRDASKSKKRDTSKSKKKESHKDKKSYSNERKPKKDESLEKIPSKPKNQESKPEIIQNASSQSILDRIQKKVKPQIEINKSRERSRSKDKEKIYKKQDTVNSISSGISLQGESKEKNSKEDIQVDQSETDKKGISLGSKKRDDQQKVTVKTSSQSSLSSNNLGQTQRQAGKEDNIEDKKHATHPNFFSNYFSALKKNTSDKFEDNSNSNNSKNKNYEKKPKSRNRSESSQNSRSSSSTRKKSKYSKHNSSRESKR